MIIKDISIYDGSQLQERFAYHYFGKEIERTGNIVAFIAPMKVEAEFMVDKEDLKNKDYIYSESSMQFLIEIPEIKIFESKNYFLRKNRQTPKNIEKTHANQNCKEQTWSLLFLLSRDGRPKPSRSDRFPR